MSFEAITSITAAEAAAKAAVAGAEAKAKQLLSDAEAAGKAAVEAAAAELEAKKQQIYAMEQRQFADKAEQLRGKGDVLVRMEGLSPDGLRRAAIAIQETCGGRAAVFSGDDAAGYKYAVGHPGGDLRQWVKELNAALSGRGGGKPGFVQGSVSAGWKEITAFFSRQL